ncbi:MAG: lipid-binding SYLF domain-containing protein [Vicinamibacterales bacterium]
MPYLSKFIHMVSAASLVLVASAPAAQAGDAATETERLQKSVGVLRELVSTPDDAIPEHILDRAEAVVVIPTLVKGGFILGAEHGKGVMSVRDRATGRWSLPSFVQITGGSIGWQIGVQSTDLVLLVMNADGVDELLRSEFKLGANASVAAGPVGRSAEASTDATMSAKILAYSRSKGLFAGLSLQGAALKDDAEANGNFYGREQSAREVFAMPTTPAPEAAAAWLSALTSIAPFSR